MNYCQMVHSLILRLKYALTFTVWSTSANKKLILFLIFPRKQDLTSCFLGKIRKLELVFVKHYAPNYLTLTLLDYDSNNSTNI